MAAVSLGSKAIGSIVKMPIDGNPRNFIVAHQGKPSSAYDDSFIDGTILLLEKPIYQGKFRDNGDNAIANAYKGSLAESYASSFYTRITPAVLSGAVKTVKVPYASQGTSLNTPTIYAGANGLETKGFLLSAKELGGDGPAIGSVLSYFFAGGALRAYDEGGSSVAWWTRSPYLVDYYNPVYAVDTGGLFNEHTASNMNAYRPAIVMDSGVKVNDDGSLVANAAPTVPASITVPATINGGVSFELSWGESTDADGNLSGYKVDKSTDGGSTWAQIYQGTLLKTTDTVAFGTASVIYRVKAYDSEGAESAYQTSPTRTVINNTAPTAPGSITVPTAVIGGDPLVIVWTGATDGESNLSGYELSRSVAGAAFAVIYKGANLFYNDTITKGWTTVAYRVRAYDTQNAYSNYTTGPTRTVDNVTAPSISSGTSGDMGTQNGGITWQYSIAQAESLTTTVTETLDGATIRTYTAALGAANTFTLSGGAWQKILNGAHTMKVTATAGGKTSTHTVTFTKAVYAIKVTLDEPLPSETLAGKIVVTVNGSVPGDAVLQVLATNAANDPSPVWEDITASVKNARPYLFTNAAAANGPAVNFIVNVSRGPSGLPVYISSIGGAFE